MLGGEGVRRSRAREKLEQSAEARSPRARQLGTRFVRCPVEPHSAAPSATGVQALHRGWWRVETSTHESPGTPGLCVTLPLTSCLTLISPSCSFPVSASAGLGQTSVVFQSLLYNRGNPFCMETLLGRKSSVSRVSSRQACHRQSW